MHQNADAICNCYHPAETHHDGNKVTCNHPSVPEYKNYILSADECQGNGRWVLRVSLIAWVRELLELDFGQRMRRTRLQLDDGLINHVLEFKKPSQVAEVIGKVILWPRRPHPEAIPKHHGNSKGATLRIPSLTSGYLTVILSALWMERFLGPSGSCTWRAWVKWRWSHSEVKCPFRHPGWRRFLHKTEFNRSDAGFGNFQNHSGPAENDSPARSLFLRLSSRDLSSRSSSEANGSRRSSSKQLLTSRANRETVAITLTWSPFKEANLSKWESSVWGSTPSMPVTAFATRGLRRAAYREARRMTQVNLSVGDEGD